MLFYTRKANKAPNKIPAAQGQVQKGSQMKKTAHNSEIVATAINSKLDYKVALLRKTNKAGEIRHFVTVTNHQTGKRLRFHSVLGLAPAYAQFKALANA